MDDKELIARILSGHTEGFRLLYGRYKQAAWEVACYICGSEELAKDAVQQSFISAFKYMYSFRQESSFKTWLLKIVKNECYFQLKKEDKFDHMDIADIEENTLELRVGPDQFSKKERQLIIESVMKRLKSNEALVLQLFYLQELSVQEVAEVIGATANNTKVILHRARKNFKIQLEKSKLAEGL